jgi:predicted dehydrogenase
MTSAPIRLGIVGAGRIVRSEHLPRFRAIDGVEIVGVANRSSASSHRAAGELGIERAYDDWRTLLADPDIDAVLIGAWPYLHGPVTIAALEAGKHVLTEARMAATAADARAMLRTSLAHPGLVAMVVPSSFSLWADATIARLIAAGSIGRVRHLRVTWDASGPGDPGEYWRWMRRYSGENVMALGIAYEAIVRWGGAARAVSAVTSLGEPFRPGPDGPVRADVPDHVLAIAEFPDEVTGVIEMSARTNPVESNRAVFYGSDGTLIVDFAGQRIERVERDGRRDLVVVRDEDRAEWTAEIDFVAAIRGEREVTLTDFATGVEYMSFVEAVGEASASGRRIAVRA